MFKMLGKCLDKLKKDNFLWVPFLAYSLFFSLVNKALFSTPSSFGVKEFGVVFIQNICQTFVGVLFVLMLVNLSKNELDIYKVWSLFLARLNSNLIRFSILVNLPLMVIVFFGMYFASSGGDQNSLNNVLMFGLLLGGMYIVIPISAFGYFSTIAYVLTTKYSVELLKGVFLFCFQNYRLCIKWFWFIVFINSFQLFVMPLYFTEFILKDVVVSGFQSLLLTVSMIYSYYFYKENVVSRLNLKSTIDILVDETSEDLKNSLIDESTDKSSDESISNTN
jgi:hypothetical protein